MSHDDDLEPIGFYEILAGLAVTTWIIILALFYAVDYFLNGERP